MHILMALLGAIGVVAVLLWRVQQTVEAARGFAETAGEARGLWRRWQWWRKASYEPLADIKDPREAVTAAMIAIAQSDGPMTEREEQKVRELVGDRFGASETQALEMMAQARWRIGTGNRDLDTTLARLVSVVAAGSVEQRRDAVAMLRSVLDASPGPRPAARESIARFARKLGV